MLNSLLLLATKIYRGGCCIELFIQGLYDVDVKMKGNPSHFAGACAPGSLLPLHNDTCWSA